MVHGGYVSVVDLAELAWSKRKVRAEAVGRRHEQSQTVARPVTISKVYQEVK